MTNTPTLLIHGGAGDLTQHLHDGDMNSYQLGIEKILAHGYAMLRQQCSAVETVVECVALLEDDPLFNAGRGSVLNELGNVEMDAAVMNGENMHAGAVACVSNITNPVKLARVIMQHSRHVLFCGEGAEQIAKQHNLSQSEHNYFITDLRRQQLQNAKQKNKVNLDHDGKLGTVGAVALDAHGNIAAATSTGGLTNKAPGRIGDSPLIGAGVYADNQTCAVSSTGIGEDFMRSLLPKTVADLMQFSGLEFKDAIDRAMKNFVKRFDGHGGIIALDRFGHYTCRFTTKHMLHGWIDNVGTPRFNYQMSVENTV